MGRIEIEEHKYNLRKRKLPSFNSAPSNRAHIPPRKLKRVELHAPSREVPSPLPFTKLSSILQAVRDNHHETLSPAMKSRGHLDEKQLIKLLRIAVQCQSAQCAQILLRCGADPNIGNPLLVAAESGNLSIVSELLKCGAKVRVKDPMNGGNVYHKLVYSVSGGKSLDIEPILLLLQECKTPANLINAVDNKGFSPLVLALQRLPNNSNIVRLLMKYGAKPSLPKDRKSKKQKKTSSKWTSRLSPETSLVHHAVNHSLCANGFCHCDILIETLITVCGLDKEVKNHINMTPFLCAVYNNNLAAMKTLVRLGADIHAVCKDWDMGALAIWMKFHLHQINTGLWLLQQGLDVNKTLPDGRPIASAFLNHPRVFKKLIGQPGLEDLFTQIISKSSLSSLNFPLTDPLFWGTFHRMEYLVTLLLDHGTEVERKKGKYAPISIAAEYGFSDFLQMLLCGLTAALSTFSWQWAVRNAIRMKHPQALRMMLAIKLDRQIVSLEYEAVSDNSEAVNDTNCLVQLTLSTPDSLQNSCRRCVWASLPVGKRRSILIPQLPLPQLLNDYIMLKVL